MSFRRFLVVYIASVAIPIVIIFLCSMGMAFEILRHFLTYLVMLLIFGIGFIVAEILGAKVTEAPLEEIQREDDVLLEAVAFSQSILFVLLSLMQSEDNLQRLLLTGTVMTTVAFYAIRAWAKIRNSPKYRYYSMIAFAVLFGNSVASILKLSFNIPDDFIIIMSMAYSTVALSLVIIAEKVFKKRYGYESSK